MRRETRVITPDASPEWAVCQNTPAGRAIVWVRAPDACTAAQRAHKRVGHLGGWPTDGCDDLEVFPRADYGRHATPADYTRIVIDD